MTDSYVMSSLHIFSKPLRSYAASALDNLIAEQDQVILVGDACYSYSHFQPLCANLFVLKEDATARAISSIEQNQLIDYSEFVALTLATSNSISW